MITLIIIGIVLLALFCIAMIPVRIVIEYKEALRIRLVILFVSITLLPKAKKTPNPLFYSARGYKKKLERLRKKADKKAGKKADKKRKISRSEAENKAGAKKDIGAIISLIGEILLKLKKFFGKKLHIKAARLIITVGAEDAAKTALLYAGVSQGVSYIAGFLYNNASFKYDKNNISVNADFCSGKTAADILIIFRIHVGSVLKLGFSLAYSYIRDKLSGNKRTNTVKNEAQDITELASDIDKSQTNTKALKEN